MVTPVPDIRMMGVQQQVNLKMVTATSQGRVIVRWVSSEFLWIMTDFKTMQGTAVMCRKLPELGAATVPASALDPDDAPPRKNAWHRVTHTYRIWHDCYW